MKTVKVMIPVANEGMEHGCHACGEERIPVLVRGVLICPECHSEKIVCIEVPIPEPVEVEGRVSE